MRKFFQLLAFCVLSHGVTMAQQKTVTGTVTQQDGTPIGSASVSIKGTSKGTVTDENGHFSLPAPATATLVVSSVGFILAEHLAAGSSPLAIILQPVASDLTGVVVTALGIVRQEKSLGYSTSQVKSKDLVQAKSIDVTNGLTGKVAGLQINTVNNGVFASNRITLRGNRSLTGNNQPLVILDGAIFYNDLSTLNPDDIESVNVLKGSSAAAVYGSDASNGVLIVTTKKGIPGKPVITFSTTLQRESLSYMPSFQNEFGSNGGESFPLDFNDMRYYIPYENQQYGPAFNGRIVPLGRPTGDGSLLLVPYSSLKNEKRKFFDNALTTQNNISYSGGDESSRFFISAQDVHTHGIMPKDFGNRQVVRAGASKSFGIFSVNFSVAYTNKYTNTTNTGSVYDAVMNVPQHVPLTMLKDWKTNKFADPSGYFNDFGDNPYFLIDNFRNKVSENALSAKVQLALHPVSWLNIIYRTSINNANTRTENISGAYKYNVHSQSSDTVIYANQDASGLDTVHEGTKFNAAFPFQPSYIASTNANFLFTSDLLATFTRQLSKDWNGTATLGASYIDNRINSLTVNAGPLFFPVYNVNSLTGIPSLGQYNSEAKKLGYFVDAGVGYKEFAYLHGSYRTDIDSRLSSSNRYIPYYDIDASLVLSDVIKSIGSSKVLDYLKVRAAHSVTGNASALAGGSPYIANGAYATVPTFLSAPGFPFNGLGGYQLNSVIANPDIKPETITENEAGVEAGLFNNRVSVVVNVYQQQLKDGIVYAKIARSAGFTSALINAASTRTRGIETEIRATVVKSAAVTWDIGVNYSYNKSKVLSINGEVQSIQIGGTNGDAYAVVGQSYPVIQTTDWTRDPEGHVIVDKVTGNPSVDPNLKILGNASPKNILGLTTRLSYKQFTFGASADYRGGYKIFNSVGQVLDFTGIGSTTAATSRQRFVFPNSVVDLGNGKYAPNTNITTDDAGYNFFGGSFLNVGSNYVISAAAFKLREVVIGYDFPKKWYAQAKFLQDINLSVSGRNLLMIRPKTNQWTDPEFSEDNSNSVGRTSINQTPPTRILSATLSLRF